MTVPLPSAAVAVPAPAMLEQVPATTPVPAFGHAPRQRLAGQIGDVVLLRYALSPRFLED